MIKKALAILAFLMVIIAAGIVAVSARFRA